MNLRSEERRTNTTPLPDCYLLDWEPLIAVDPRALTTAVVSFVGCVSLHRMLAASSDPGRTNQGLGV